MKNFPPNGFCFCCDVNRSHVLRGRRKWVSRGFEDYRKGMVVNGTNTYADQEFLTEIQRTSRKSVSKLQSFCEPPKFIS